jgi:hypothetical protein
MNYFFKHDLSIFNLGKYFSYLQSLVDGVQKVLPNSVVVEHPRGKISETSTVNRSVFNFVRSAVK